MLVKMRNYRTNVNTNEYWSKRCFKNKGIHTIESFLNKLYFHDIICDVKQNNLKAISLLEIGCASGNQLKALKQIFNKEIPDVKLNLYGVDISTEMIKIARNELPDITFFDCSIEEFIKTNNLTRYDYVISHHVIEHLDNPYDVIYHFIEHTNRLVCIEVPFEIHIDSPDHVQYFFEEEFEKYDSIKKVTKYDDKNKGDWIALTFVFECFKLATEHLKPKDLYTSIP